MKIARHGCSRRKSRLICFVSIVIMFDLMANMIDGLSTSASWSEDVLLECTEVHIISRSIGVHERVRTLLALLHLLLCLTSYKRCGPACL